MIKPSIQEESRRLYTDWKTNHSDMDMEDYYNLYATEEMKEWHKELEEEIEQAEKEGLLV